MPILTPPNMHYPQMPQNILPQSTSPTMEALCKFGSCKFADTCSYSHFAASPSISCPNNSNCDSILLELQTLKSLISSLSTQLNEYGSILSSLQQLSSNHSQLSPSQNSPSHAFCPPSIDQHHSPLLTTPNKLPSIHKSPSPLLIHHQPSNNNSHQSPIMTAPNSPPCQTTSQISSPHVPTLLSYASSQTSRT